jgi:CheY-like chemotaxis protein
VKSNHPRPGPILLVDDDPDFLSMNASILAARGYAVECRSDPRAALADLESLAPALVVTDLMMQSLDSGFTLAKAIKTDPRFSAIPVIIVTAVASQKGFDFRPRSAADLAAMHADAFFDKPVAPGALIAKVEELLR